MKTLHTVGLLLLLSACSRSVVTQHVVPPLPPVPTTKKVVWSDEFTTDGLPDSRKWAYDAGGNGWGNNELQFYTNARTENARVEGGLLVIEARKEAYQGKNYTSARLVTKNIATWQYGRMEIRAKLPAGRGTWPAIWMLGENIARAGWPLCGEIDIMEHVGFDEGVIHGTVHTQAYNHSINTQLGKQQRLPTATTAFHVYAIDWTTDQIEFSIDGQPFYTIKKSVLGSSTAQWPFDQPFYLLLNVAVGGNWGGQQGVDETIWPRRMEVDYVRIYQ